MSLLFTSSERYLRARLKKNPEDKYRIRETNNWDIGWQMKEIMASGDYRSSKFAFHNSIPRPFMSRRVENPIMHSDTYGRVWYR